MKFPAETNELRQTYVQREAMPSANELRLFGDRLRKASLAVAPIADICRKTGINRQQFNKYMAGQVMPSASTLRRICGCLGILEHTLFESATTDDLMVQKSFLSFLHQLYFCPLFGQATISRYDEVVPELPVGIYHCYFTLQNVPGMLLRSLLLIRTTGKLKTFVRVSKFRSVDGRQKSLIRSFHTGVVVANSTEIYLLGVNRYPPYQFSSMIIDHNPQNIANTFPVCHTVTRNTSQLIVAPTYVSRLQPDVTARQALAQVGILHESACAEIALALGSLR